MSGSISTAAPSQVCGSFFYDDTPTVAASLDLQTALQTATPIVLQAQQTASAILPTLQGALQNANYFLSGDLRSLPTTPGPSGTAWNNGGVISLVGSPTQGAPAFSSLSTTSGISGPIDGGTVAGKPILTTVAYAALVPNIQTQVGTLQTQVGTLQTQTSGLQTQVNSVQSSLSNYATTTALSSAVAGVTQGRLLGVARIVASTTYTPPTGTRYVEVELIGGGGGSGGVPAPSSSSQVTVSTGGSAGAYLKATITDPTVFTGASVTIGTPGAGGAVGTKDGSPGGTSSFGSYSAPGGSGGRTSTATAFPSSGLLSGASSGAPSSADVSYSGAGPTAWIAISTSSGVTSAGGASLFGPGGYAGVGVPGSSQGAAGGFGAGGGGVMAPSSYTLGLAGASGGQGYCIVRAYS